MYVPHVLYTQALGNEMFASSVTFAPCGAILYATNASLASVCIVSAREPRPSSRRRRATANGAPHSSTCSSCEMATPDNTVPAVAPSILYVGVQFVGFESAAAFVPAMDSVYATSTTQLEHDTLQFSALVLWFPTVLVPLGHRVHSLMPALS